DACDAHPDLARVEEIGQSEENRPLLGVTLGRGPRTVTLVAGAHADEPVGPETLLHLVTASLAYPDRVADVLERYTFRLVPHVNPDGAARNAAWVAQWSEDADPTPALAAYLLHRDREPPGRDVEFGYPVMRRENAAASRFLFRYDPISLHMSLHGMGFSEGALLLIERRWADGADALKAGWRDAARAAGLRLHDHDRKGEKGFHYYGPGFHATPEGAAMRAYFRDLGDKATAALFFHASMEWAVLTGRDPVTGRTPLCLVTELPLFLISAPYAHTPGVPALYERFNDSLPLLTLAARAGSEAPLRAAIEEHGLRALPLADAIRLQLTALDLGLAAVDAAHEA
ncbi:MAG TPA: M14 family zinc carboxypeptidase, partial [Rhodothermales bacterium]|nr:M14 family zinc carboxypeptidase [Rhodothermales bacterium]